MPKIDHAQLAKLVWQTRPRLEPQANFAAKLGGSFQSINRWENGRTKPLPIALKQIEDWRHQMGEAGKNWLTKYFLE